MPCSIHFGYDNQFCGDCMRNKIARQNVIPGEAERRRIDPIANHCIMHPVYLDSCDDCRRQAFIAYQSSTHPLSAPPSFASQRQALPRGTRRVPFLAADQLGVNFDDPIVQAAQRFALESAEYKDATIRRFFLEKYNLETDDSILKFALNHKCQRVVYTQKDSDTSLDTFQIDGVTRIVFTMVTALEGNRVLMIWSHEFLPLESVPPISD